MSSDSARSLAAITALLQRTHLTPPDLLPEAVDAAIEHLDARGVIYLADYTQTLLVPLRGRSPDAAPPMAIDATPSVTA